MFANHLLQPYVGNVERQGNAPAEANHSSILRRLGNAFYETPVMLIQALMKRHQDLTAERHYVMIKYRLETSAEAWNSRDGTEKEALLSIRIWGMELYRSAAQDSVRLNMMKLSNGKRALINKDDPGQVLVSLDPNSTVCYCRFWTAYNLPEPIFVADTERKVVYLISPPFLHFASALSLIYEYLRVPRCEQ
jgi:hypothetical protein